MEEEVKHFQNDETSALRGWSCILLVIMEVFDGWGKEAVMQDIPKK